MGVCECCFHMTALKSLRCARNRVGEKIVLVLLCDNVLYVLLCVERTIEKHWEGVKEYLSSYISCYEEEMR